MSAAAAAAVGRGSAVGAQQPCHAAPQVVSALVRLY
jgi:hypothetical protein